MNCCSTPDIYGFLLIAVLKMKFHKKFTKFYLGLSLNQKLGDPTIRFNKRTIETTVPNIRTLLCMIQRLSRLFRMGRNVSQIYKRDLALLWNHMKQKVSGVPRSCLWTGKILVIKIIFPIFISNHITSRLAVSQRETLLSKQDNISPYGQNNIWLDEIFSR